MITGQLGGPQHPYSQHWRSTHHQRTSYVYTVRKAFCPDLPTLEEHQQEHNLFCVDAFQECPHINYMTCDIHIQDINVLTPVIIYV